MSTVAASSQPSPGVVVTEIGFSYSWYIDNFTSRKEKVGEYVSSPRFATGSNLQDSWFLLCYPRGRAEEEEGYLSVYLHSAFRATAKAVMSILNSNGEKTNNVDYGLRSYIPGAGWGARKFISREDLLSKGCSLLTAGRLGICCDILHYPDQTLPPDPVNQIIKDYNKLLLSAEFNDILLVVGGKKIPAHRAILSSRSPVFSRMFNSEMKESASGEIHIDDITEETVQNMLSFLYTAEAPKTQRLAHQLYYAADKYQIDELKNICTHTLVKNLAVSNCVETLILAERHNGEDLKTSVLDYIIDNIEEVMESEAWKEVGKSNPLLVNEVLCLHVKKYGKKKG